MNTSRQPPVSSLDLKSRNNKENLKKQYLTLKNREPLIKPVYKTRGLKQPSLMQVIKTESILETDAGIEMKEDDGPPRIVLQRVLEDGSFMFSKNRNSIPQISVDTMDDTVVMTESVMTEQGIINPHKKQAGLTFRETLL